MSGGGLYASIRDLPLEISAHELRPLQLDVSASWRRLTTIVALGGGGHEGVGEDIVWQEPDQLAHREAGAALQLGGRHTFGSFSNRLDEQVATLPACEDEHGAHYRRWAYESAGLDLALRQAGTTLAERLEREPAPLRYVVSTGLGSPPDTERLQYVIDAYPGARFKIDYSEEWTPELIEQLAELDRIDVVDYKGLYRGAFSGPPADPEMYRRVAEGLPDVYLEDPAHEALDALAEHRDRITWDAALYSRRDLEELPFPPRVVNIKPSRFGTVKSLLSVYEYCQTRDIGMYGGGQLELGAGRGQIQYLASLFHPEAPNDVAPSAFNAAELRPDLPPSPLPPRPDPLGFRWRPS